MNQVLLLEEALNHALEPNGSLLIEGARYAVLAKGKRVRPLLVLNTCLALGGAIEDALNPACALEFVHTYSMIHDDLPCMDDDDYRRGQPSLHKVMGEATAVLVGDFLLTHAFLMLAKAPKLSDGQKICLIDTLSSAAGGNGMVEGQIRDIASEGKEIDLPYLQQIHKKKTGALMTASLSFGAIIAGADEKTRKRLETFGETLGLAFQIVDDLLDTAYSHKKEEASIGSDLKNQKATYLSLLGEKQARTEADNLLSACLTQLSVLPYNMNGLTEMVHSLIERLEKDSPSDSCRIPSEEGCEGVKGSFCKLDPQRK